MHIHLMIQMVMEILFVREIMMILQMPQNLSQCRDRLHISETSSML